MTYRAPSIRRSDAVSIRDAPAAWTFVIRKTPSLKLLRAIVLLHAIYTDPHNGVSQVIAAICYLNHIAFYKININYNKLK